MTQIRLETACVSPVTETISSFMCVPLSVTKEKQGKEGESGSPIMF